MLQCDNSWKITPLQNCILNVAKYIHEICTKYGISYYLMGGSALGAIRHKGFIPWDDDLDIFMRPDDYDRFRRIFKQNGNHNDFYLQEWGASNGMISLAKLRYNHSTLIEEDLKDWNIHHGVYVDIFILHNCPDNKFSRYWQYLWAKYLVAKGAANRNYSRRGGIIKLILTLMRLTPKRHLVNHALKQVYKYNKIPSTHYCHFLGRARLKKGLYPKFYFDETKTVNFEKTQLYVPKQVEAYLKDRWGDYMKIPPIEEIKHFQHSWKWSVTDTFPNFNNDEEYTDEKNLIC